MRRPALLAAVLLALPIGLLPAASAVAAPAGSVGADVSAPQCDADAPATFIPPTGSSPAFAVVGVNDGVGTVANPCLAAEVAWAQTLPGGGRAPLELYVNTQHPSPAAARWWPRDDRTAGGRTVRGPYGHCRGADDRACAYVYGASLTDDDLARATTAGIVPAAQRWWLDVEKSNTWGRSTSVNRAVLEGMVASFARVHVPTGVYATHVQWDAIVGAVPHSSPLTGQASWLAGAVTVTGAMDRCSSAPLVAGSRVVLAQAVQATDSDVACARLTATPAPTASGTPTAGHVLQAVVPRWSPAGVRFTYRWLRDGRAIPSATAARYRVTAADRHRLLSVRVTGTLRGYDAAIRSSAGRRVH